MKSSRYFLVGKTHCADGESKGTRGDARKSKVAFLVRDCFPLLGVPFARESYPGGENKVSILVHHRPADGTQRFTWVLAGGVLRSRNSHCWCVGQGSGDVFDLLRLRQKRKATEQGAERQPAPLESVARGS